MHWRPKEKEASLEEAIESIKTELEPYWFRVLPQFVVLPKDDKFSLFPINSTFVKESWFVLFVDLTTQEGLSAVRMLNAWRTRYQSFEFSPMVILAPSYRYLFEKERTRTFLESLGLHCAAVLDFDGKLFNYFRVYQLPKVLLIHEGQVLFGMMGNNWIVDAERSLQKFFRRKDPGLPLPMVFQPQEQKLLTDIERIEFGSHPRFGKPFSIENSYYQLKGRFEQDQESVFTSDPNASLSFETNLNLAVVAESLSKTIEIPEVACTLGDRPLPQALAAAGVQSDEAGKMILRVKTAGMYPVIKQNMVEKKRITLFFTNANHAPIRIYGLRLASISKLKALG